MSTELTNKQISHLKGLGQKLDPVLVIGRNGVTESFVKGLNEALDQHELVKVRFGDFKEQKKTLAPELAAKAACQLIQRVGNVAVYFRQQAAPERRKIAI